MISILIVEDNSYKLETIVKLLKEDLMINEEYINAVEDIKSAKKMLMTRHFDLLILDLVLPLEKNEEATPENGVGFLKDIYRSPTLNSPIHIIGITAFNELMPKFNEEFHSNVWHLINYDATEWQWQEKLKNLVNHLLSTRRSFLEKTRNVNNYDIAIITALNSPEFDHVLKLSSSWISFKLEDDATIYYACEFEKNGRIAKIVAACADQMGMTASANLATKIILAFKPKYIFSAGICAGLKDRDLNYGDIVIAEQTWDYGSGKIKEIVLAGNSNGVSDIVFEPDPRPIQLNAEVKAKINSFLRRIDIMSKIQMEWKSAKPKTMLKAKLGPVASGSYVIASETTLNQIKSTQRKLLAVEMEAYGLYYSTENSPEKRTKAIMIKSVSDFGDSNKNDSYQEYSSFTSAQFIYHFIVEELL
jgi:nucleoside phosphorylase/CheY-like chemotaxis protein